MNFLTRLIQRNLPATQSQLPVLEPRLPSRFEPLAQADALAAVERVVFHDPPPTTRPAEIMARRESRQAASQQPSQQPLPTQDEQAQKLDPSVSAIRSALDSARATIQPVASPITRPSEPQLARATNDADERPQAGTSPPGTTRPADAPHMMIQLIDTPAAAPSPKPTVRPEVRAAPAQPEPSLTESREDAPAVEATIQVTIGRVDVRAVMASATPPARPAPRPNKLSLEDYLRGRNGGAR